MTLEWEKITICYIIPGQVEVSCKGGMIKHGWAIVNIQLCTVCEQKRAWQVNYYHQVQKCTNLLKHWFFSSNVYSPSFFVKSWESYFLFRDCFWIWQTPNPVVMSKATRKMESKVTPFFLSLEVTLVLFLRAFTHWTLPEKSGLLFCPPRGT